MICILHACHHAIAGPAFESAKVRRGCSRQKRARAREMWHTFWDNLDLKGIRDLYLAPVLHANEDAKDARGGAA